MGWGEAHGDRIVRYTDVEPVDVSLDQALVAHGISVYACTVPVAGRGHQACLTMSFLGADGLTIPPIVLVLTPGELRALAPLIAAAVDTAVSRGRSPS